MIAAVTGATGVVGGFVVRRLLAEGVAVRAWHRGAPPPVAGLAWLPGDLRDPASMAALVDGADCLVHCAYQHVPGRYRGGEGDDLDGFLAANVGGSLALLAAARRAGVGRAVVLSSRAVFGDRRPPAIVGDDAPLMPDSHYGAAKMALEAFVSSFGRGDGWAVAALRPTGVYGLVEPVERSKWFDLVAAALDGRDLPPARAGSEVHGDDVAAAVWLLLTADADRVAGRAFNCSDLVVSSARVVEALAALGLAAPGTCPEAASPTVVMACPGLEGLGLSFGGEALFRRTVAELAAAVLAARSA